MGRWGPCIWGNRVASESGPQRSGRDAVSVSDLLVRDQCVLIWIDGGWCEGRELYRRPGRGAVLRLTMVLRDHVDPTQRVGKPPTFRIRRFQIMRSVMLGRVDPWF